MKEMFLEEILAVTRNKVAAQKRHADMNRLREHALEIRQDVESFRLSKALNRKEAVNIIAEIKRASPSKGIINDQINVVETAFKYKHGGAAAISVLTEENYFKGSLDDLREVHRTVDLPILRKDFTVDPFQIYEAATAGADAILLIVAALSSETLGEFQSLAHELGLDVLVEVHTIAELKIALNIGAKLIGINNRDLKTLNVSLDVSRNLIKHRPENVLVIAESGISTREEIDELRSLGYDGFLVGESLMRETTASKLAELAL